jgi:hypothetical protein
MIALTLSCYGGLLALSQGGRPARQRPTGGTPRPV